MTEQLLCIGRIVVMTIGLNTDIFQMDKFNTLQVANACIRKVAVQVTGHLLCFGVTAAIILNINIVYCQMDKSNMLQQACVCIRLVAQTTLVKAQEWYFGMIVAMQQGYSTVN